MRLPSSNTGFIFKGIGILIALAGILAFLSLIPSIVKMVIISALIAYVLNPFANILESRGMSRTFTTITIFLFIVVSIGIAYLVLLPVLSNQIEALQEGLNPEKAGQMIANLETFLVSNLAFLGVKDLNLLTKIQQSMAHVGEWIFAHFLDAASLLTSLILIPFLVFFFLKDGRTFKKSFVSIVPNRYFEFTLYLLHKLNTQMGNYLRGQIIDATMVGILAVFGLWLIGIEYYFLIGIFTGLANLVPYFGPITGALLAVVASILQTGGFQLALYVVITFIVIKLVDDALIQPIVVAKSVHMHPVTVLLSVLIGGKLFGILGMLLSVPVVGFLKVVTHESIINYRRYRQV